jgi:sec-independent protein translocase protein TatC
MSLGDHLEELRARLILAILGLVLGMVVSLIFGKAILRAIEWPYNATVLKQIKKTGGSQQQKEALALVETVFQTLTARLAAEPNAAPELDPKRVAFLHDVFTQAVKTWLHEPAGAGDAALPFDQRLRTIAPAEAFMAYMKISLIGGLILTAPWIFYQIWAFVAAGLYPKERQYVYKAVPFSAGLFIIGALFFLFVIARITLLFFLQFNTTVGVAPQWTLQTYISFVTVLMLVFGIAFQTPIAVFILVRTGLVQIATLRNARKYVMLGLAFLAAVATPPDVVSMIALLVPLYGLFELGIVLGWVAERRAKRNAQEDAAPKPKPPSGPAGPAPAPKLPEPPASAGDSGAAKPSADSAATELPDTDSSGPKPDTDSSAPQPPQADSSASQPDADAGAPKSPDADPSAPEAPDGDSSEPEPPPIPPSGEVPPRS